MDTKSVIGTIFKIEMKNKIIIFLIFFVGVRLGTLAQDSINIMPLIHEEDYNVDDYMRDVINVRKYFEKNEALGFLKNIPYNPEHDTIYAIEMCHDEEWLDFYLSYWSSRFHYSVQGFFGKELFLYDKQIFFFFFVYQTELWNKDAILSKVSERYGAQIYMNIIRIIFFNNKIITNNFFVRNYDDALFYDKQFLNSYQGYILKVNLPEELFLIY